MTGKRVLLAFSGGSDSVRAATILTGMGYKVDALTLDMTGDETLHGQAGQKAAGLGIGFGIVDVREVFRRDVIEYFISGYMSGRTPAPCTVCNARIKWDILYKKAVEGGYDHIATGHYFGIERDGGKYYVTKAEDQAKDQSYYLWMIPQHILSMALTPMAGQIKKDFIKTAEAPPKESMGICFLSGGKYADFIRERRPGQIAPGEVTDKDGNVIGVHNGLPFYTIGQKKGPGLPDGMHVIGINAGTNRIIAGSGDDLLHRNLIISGLTSPDPQDLLRTGGVSVKIRGIGRNPGGYCTIEEYGPGTHIVMLDEPAWAAAPGQPVVFYAGGRVMGGGFLEKSY